MLAEVSPREFLVLIRSTSLKWKNGFKNENMVWLEEGMLGIGDGTVYYCDQLGISC